MKVKVNERTLRWLMLAAIVVCFAINYSTIFDKKMDQNGDNYNYYQLARSLALGHGYVSEIGPVPEPHMHFPPGYPAFLSLFYRIFPDNVVPLKFLNGLLLLASLLLLFRIVRKTTGRQGHWIALATCLLAIWHPDLLRWSTILMSEMLYITISLGIIALCLDLDLEKLRQKDIRQLLMLVGLCLLIAALYFVRTMGISLVLAVSLTFLVLGVRALIRSRKDTKTWVMPLLVAAVVLLSFGVAKGCWDHRNERVQPGYKGDYLTTFSTPVNDESTDNMLLFRLNRVKNNLKAFVPYYIPNSLVDPENANFKLVFPEQDRRWGLGIVVIVFMLVGLLSMKGLSLLLILYFLFTFGALMLYPPYYADVRYFIPLLPLMLAALLAGVCWTLHFLVRCIFRKKPAQKVEKWSLVLTPAVCVLLFVWLMPIYNTSLNYYRVLAKLPSIGKMPNLERYQLYLDTSTTCDQFPEDWLFLCRKPEIFYFHSHYRHSLPMPREGSPEEVLQFLMDKKIQVIMMDDVYRTSTVVMVPVIQAYPHLFTVYWKWDNGNSSIVGFIPNLPK